MKLKHLFSKYYHVLFFVVGVIFSIIYGEWRQKNEYNIFHNSNIIGKIEEITNRKGAVQIKIEKNDTIFTFVPDNGSYLFQRFHQYAEIGDSIVKLTKSHTLYLYKSGRCFKYTFYHYE